MIKSALNARKRRQKLMGFTLIEIAFTMIGTLMLALAFSSVIMLQSQRENLALARLTAFRRAAHGSQSITDLMRDGAETLEHNSFNPMTTLRRWPPAARSTTASTPSRLPSTLLLPRVLGRVR